MPRGGGYASLPDTNDELDHVENRSNSNEARGEQFASSVRATTDAASSATGGGGRNASLPIAELKGGDSSFTVPEPEGPSDPTQEGSKGRSAGARHVEEASGSKGGGKDSTDFAPGLPTAEGVFVGSPVDQNPLYPSGGGGHHHQATVITSLPPAYSSSRGAAGPSAMVTSSEGGPNPPRTVILVNNPEFGEWGRGPQPFTCCACGFSGYSNTAQDPCSTAPILAAACCCLMGLWVCSFVPFLIPDLRDTIHRCPNCHMTVGRSRQC